MAHLFHTALLLGDYTTARRQLDTLDVNSVAIPWHKHGLVFLLENGLEVDLQNRYGMTVLMEVCELADDSEEFRDVFFLILSYSPTLCLENNFGQTFYDFLRYETVHPEVEQWLKMNRSG